MKNFFSKLVLSSALAVTLVMAGCNKYDADIKNLCEDLTELEGRVEILETFYKWANEYGIEEHDAELQRQIDELRRAFEEGGGIINGDGRLAELERRLDQLIAGSTLTIADIADKLDDHDDALADLYERLETIEAYDISSLLARIIALERASEAMNGEIDDIWDALDLLSETDLSEIIEGLEQLETDLDELQALVDSLTEQVAALLKKFIRNISFVPDYSDGKIPVNFINDGTTLTAQPFTVKYLVTPTKAASAIAAVFSSSDVYGHLNQVETVSTRALVGKVTVSAVTVGTGEESDVLIVTYDGSSISGDMLSAPGKELQISLRVILSEDYEDMASDIASEFAPLKFGTVALPPIVLTEFTQDDLEVNATTTVQVPSDAPSATTPSGEIAFDNSTSSASLTAPTLALDVEYDTNGDYPRLVNPVTAYSVHKQYEYVGGAWVAVNPQTAALSGSNLTAPASANHGKVVIKMNITDDGGFNQDYYFIVDVPASITLVDLSTMEFVAHDFDPAGPGTRALNGSVAQLSKLDAYTSHTTWGGNHTAWDGDKDTDQKIYLNFKTQLETVFPDAVNVTVDYEIVGMLDVSAAQHLGAVSPKNDPGLAVNAGNASIDRNNAGATTETSNHDLYIVVKATYGADNAVAELTHYFCFLMQGCAPQPIVAPDAIGNVDEVIGDLGYVIKSAEEIAAATDQELPYGQLWNKPLGATGMDLYNDTDIAEFPTGGVLDFENIFEAMPEYAGVEFTVTYDIMGQYRWKQDGQPKNWIVNNTQNQAVLTGNKITMPNGNSNGNQNEFGDRLVIGVFVSAVDKADPQKVILVDPSEFYICVALP